jgi:hypothetical protein
LIDVAVSLVLTRLRYGFHLSGDALRLLLTMVTLALTCFLAAFIPHVWLSYGIMSVTTLGCCIYSIRQIDLRMDLRSVWQRVKNGRKNEEVAE